MTPAELAAAIKAKYPSYAGMDDGELVAKITAKYPQYKAQLTPEAPAAPPEKSAMDWVMGGPEAQLSGVDKGVYQAFKGAATFPFEVAKQQVQAAVQGDPSALIPGGPVAKAEAERVVGEGAGAFQSAKQGDILAALHQALSAIPGIGGMYKDAATDVIQGNPGVGAGKVLGNVMAARVMPDVVPPAAAAAGKGIARAAGAVETATPYVKAAAKEAGPVAAGAAVDVAMGGMGTVGGLLGQAFKAAKKRVDRARISKLEREVAEIDKISKAQAGEDIANIRRAETEAIAKEKANTRLIDQIDKQQNGEWLINQRKTAAELKAAEKARDAEIRKLESDIRKGQQAEDLEGAYERIAEAQAYVDAQSRLLKSYQTEEYQLFMEAGRKKVAADKAASSAAAKDRKRLAGEAEKARVELERTKTRLIDKITKAQEKEAAGPVEVSADELLEVKPAEVPAAAPENPVLELVEKSKPVEPQLVKGVETPKAPAAPPANPVLDLIENNKPTDISDAIKKATSQNRRLLEQGVSLEERRAVLAKNKNRLPDETIETIITSDSKTPIAPNAVMVKSLMRSGNTPTDAWKIMRDAGVKENGQDAFFQAARDELSMMKAAADDGTGPALTPQQEFQYAQIRRGVKSTKRLRIEEIQELPDGQKPDKYVPVPKPPKRP